MFLVYARFMAFTFPLDDLFNVRAFRHVLPTACFAALFCDLPTLPVCDGSLLLNRDVSDQSSALVGTWSRESEMFVAGVFTANFELVCSCLTSVSSSGRCFAVELQWCVLWTSPFRNIVVACPLLFVVSLVPQLVCMTSGTTCPVWTCVFDTCRVTGIGPHGRRRMWRQPQVDHERFRKNCPESTPPVSNNVPSCGRGEVWRSPLVHAR